MSLSTKQMVCEEGKICLIPRSSPATPAKREMPFKSSPPTFRTRRVDGKGEICFGADEADVGGFESEEGSTH